MQFVYKLRTIINNVSSKLPVFEHIYKTAKVSRLRPEYLPNSMIASCICSQLLYCIIVFSLPPAER